MKTIPFPKAASLLAVASVAVLLLFLPVSVCAQAGSGVSSKKTLHSASESHYPPFCIVDAANQADGFSVELLRAALEAMGKDVTFRTGSWNEVKGWLATGEVNALPLVGRTPEREAVYDFTFPYISLHGAIVVRKENTDIRTIDDLKGHRVAVMKGDNAEEYLRRKDRGIHIQTTTTFEEALKALSDGKHDAVVIQRLVALRIIREQKLYHLKVVNRPIDEFRQDFCFAVKEGDRETLALLNEGLSIVMADGAFRSLQKKWIGALELPINRHIVVGGDRDYPPYEFLDDNGRPAGYNVELTKAIARETGLDIEIRLDDWDQIRKGLENGDIDAVHGMFYSNDRDRQFDFTSPHATIHHVAIVRKKSGKPPESVEALKGKQIVVMAGDIMHDFVLQKGFSQNVTTVPSQEKALKALANGKYDCALVARIPAMYWIKKHGWKNLVVGRQPLLSPEYCYAVPENHKALLAQFSEGLKLVEQSGEYRRITEKWLGVYETAQYGFLFFLKRIAFVVFPLVLMILAIFLWSWTLRKQVARQTRELQESRAILQAAMDYSQAGIAIADAPDGKLRYVNESGLGIREKTKEEIVNGIGIDQYVSSWQIMHLDGTPYQPDEVPLARAVKYGEICSEEFIVKRPNQEHRIVWANAAPIKNEQGDIVAGIVIFLDITQRKIAEQENRVNRMRLDISHRLATMPEATHREICDYVLEKMIALSESAIGFLGIMSDNDQVMTIHAWSKNAMETCAVHDKPIEFPIARAGVWGEPVRNREPIVLNEYNEPHPAKKGVPEGHVDIARFMAVPVIDGNKVVAVAAVGNKQLPYTDIDAQQLLLLMKSWWDEIKRRRLESERRELNEQIRQTQKIESIGNLASGIAHDFNNILFPIVGLSEFLMEEAAPNSDTYDNLKEILTAGERGRDLVKQILAFSRQSDSDTMPIRIQDVLKEVLKLTRATIPSNIRIIQDIQDDCGKITGNATQIHQVAMNLVTNAYHAVAEKGNGEIRVQLKEAELAEQNLGSLSLPAGRYAMFSVSDTGSGIAPDKLHQIFEPYYTTKGRGKGTGLGLAVAFGIIRAHRGDINVTSEIGNGACFQVYFPLTEGETVEAEQGKGKAEVMTGSGEKILLVDDEMPVAKLEKQMLDRLGYDTTMVTSSTEALSRFEGSPHAFDLLLTDMTMPDMTGDQLAQRILSIRPDIPIVICTGFSERINREHAEAIGIKGFLMKPVVKSEMAGMIFKALNEK